jgi:hypothetical protein
MLAAVVVAIIVTAAGSLAGPIQEKKRKDNARILLMIDIDRTATDADPLTSELARRLVSGGVSVTQLSELKEKDRFKIRSAAAATVEKDRKVLKSFSFTASVIGQFSTNTLAPFNGLYAGEARGTLKAIDAANGKTIAVVNVPTARGFGNSQTQANRAALENLGKELPQDFIDQVIKSHSD